MMKKSVAMLAVCMLAQSHLAIAAGTPAPQEINIVLLGTKGGPSLLNTEPDYRKRRRSLSAIKYG